MLDESRSYAAASQLLARFFRALDQFEPDEAASCFTPDGNWLRKGIVLRGPQKITRALQERSADERKTCHSVSNLIVTPEDGMVRARYYLTVWASKPDTPLMAEYVLDSSDLMVVTGEGLRIYDKRSTPMLRA